MVPVIADPPVIPLTCHNTPVLAFPRTVAENDFWEPNATEAVGGVILTVTTDADTLTVAPLPLIAPGPGCRTANTRFPTAADPFNVMEVDET